MKFAFPCFEPRSLKPEDFPALFGRAVAESEAAVVAAEVQYRRALTSHQSLLDDLARLSKGPSTSDA